MNLIVPWLVFPAVLGLLSLGCGLLVSFCAGDELPGPLLVPVGLALVSLTGQFAILGGETAQLAAPLAVALAAIGLGLSLPWRRALTPWWPAAAIGVFAVFAAPFVLSGESTFGGYIKLDDTATYLAMLDRAMAHGYNVSGLAPSTYEATLHSSLSYGYPLGSLLPLGIGHEFVRTDTAWLWQPYLTSLAALLGCGLYQVVGGAVTSPRLRALAAFGGAQAALLYGYALWGGVKEIAAALLVVLAAALVPWTVAQRESVRACLPLAVTAAALVGVLSLGGAAWLVVPLLAALALSVQAGGLRDGARMAVALAVASAVLAIPAIAAALTWLGRTGAFTGGTELGNLLGRLSWLQVFGIWPSGDFRVPPSSLAPTRILVVLVGLATVPALVLSVRRRAWEIPIAFGAAAFACLVYVGAGSPWIGGKALASASPIVVAGSLAGASALFEKGRRVEAAVAAGVILVGVIWSNVLQYRDVDLAPSARLTALETIGKRFSGQGPTLMTEFESYGARHFLREMDTEAASELRRREVRLRAGGVANTGVSLDIDELTLGSVLPYKTLVLRRSGVASRPPSIYALVDRVGDYEVWQRRGKPGSIIEHLSLGSRFQPAAVASCAAVRRLAGRAAAAGGTLAVVKRPRALVIEPDGSAMPSSPVFGAYGEDEQALYLEAPYTMESDVRVPSAGNYRVWVGGTFKAGVDASVDGRAAGYARGRLGWPGTFTGLGTVRLAPGEHTLRLHYHGPGLRPGSSGVPEFGMGPIVLSVATAEQPVVHVRPSSAASLCHTSLDWIEAVRG